MADSRNSDSSLPPVRAARPFVRPGSSGSRSAITAAEIRPARLTRPPFRVRSWPSPSAAPVQSVSADVMSAPVTTPSESDSEPLATAPSVVPPVASAIDSPRPRYTEAMSADLAPFRGLIVATSSATEIDRAADLEMIQRGTPDAIVGTPTGASEVFLAEANREVLPQVETESSIQDIAAELLADAGNEFDDDGMSAMADFDLHADAVGDLSARAASVIDNALQGSDDSNDEEWDTPWMAGLLAGGIASDQVAPPDVAASDESGTSSGTMAAEVFERLAHRIRDGEIAVPDRTAASGDAAILAAVLSSLLLGRSTG